MIFVDLLFVLFILINKIVKLVAVNKDHNNKSITVADISQPDQVILKYH